MHRRLPVLALAIGLWPMVAGAVTRDDFLARTPQDLIHLCAASPTDPMYKEAISSHRAILLQVRLTTATH
jgi:hypothetical protein